MKNNVTQSIVVFHNRAKESLLFLYSSFKQSIGAIDRLRDENVFQQLQGKYTSQLKYQLQGIAVEVMQTSEGDFDRGQLNHTLSMLIDEYLKEFVQKIRSL